MSDTPTPSTPPTDPPTASSSPPTRWDWRPKLRWFGAEILIVVAGVLIALALNAWWADRQRADDAATLRAEILADVEQTRDVIATDLAISRETERKARAILRAMSAPDATRDSILATVGSVFLLKMWEPVNDTYTEALGSGRFNLIDDPDLRLALSRYQTQSEMLSVTSGFISTAYYGQQEPWMVANTVYSDIAYDIRRDVLEQGPFRTDFDAMAQSRELWNLLTLRLEMEVALQVNLDRLDEHAVAVLDALDQ